MIVTYVVHLSCDLAGTAQEIAYWKANVSLTKTIVCPTTHIKACANPNFMHVAKTWNKYHKCIVIVAVHNEFCNANDIFCVEFVLQEMSSAWRALVVTINWGATIPTQVYDSASLYIHTKSVYIKWNQLELECSFTGITFGTVHSHPGDLCSFILFEGIDVTPLASIVLEA